SGAIDPIGPTLELLPRDAVQLDGAIRVPLRPAVLERVLTPGSGRFTWFVDPTFSDGTSRVDTSCVFVGVSLMFRRTPGCTTTVALAVIPAPSATKVNSPGSVPSN